MLCETIGAASFRGDVGVRRVVFETGMLKRSLLAHNLDQPPCRKRFDASVSFFFVVDSNSLDLKFGNGILFGIHVRLVVLALVHALINCDFKVVGCKRGRFLSAHELEGQSLAILQYQKSTPSLVSRQWRLSVTFTQTIYLGHAFPSEGC